MSRLFTVLIASIVGGWMIFDGIHVMVRGKYMGPPTPGPWRILVSRAGIDPFSLGPLFVFLGASWIVCLLAMLRGQAWAWYGAAAVAIASLWYVPVGTALALLYLGTLYVGRAPGGP